MSMAKIKAIEIEKKINWGRCTTALSGCAADTRTRAALRAFAFKACT